MLNNLPPLAVPRAWAALAWLLRAVVGLAAAGVLLVAVAWGVLHFWIVPRVDQWRPDAEAVATRVLGARVQIERIEAQSGGAVPAFEIRGVRLYDSAGREALYLSRVWAVLSVHSLWRWGFDQLWIEAPVLDVRRLSDGRITVAGLVVSGATDEAAASDWLFGQREWGIHRGEIRWHDDTRPGAEPLVLRDVDMIWRNPGLRHQFRLDATPPPDWGQRFSVRGQFSRPFWQTQAGRWRDWSGTLYAELPQAHLQSLQRYVNTRSEWGMDWRSGTGAARLWATLQRGEWTAATADLAARDLTLQLGADLQPLALADLQGRLEWQRRGAQQAWSTRGLAFHTADGLAWPRGDLKHTQTRSEDGTLASGELEADRIDLGVLQQLGQQVPLSAGVRETLRDTQARGTVEALKLQWQAAPAGGEPRWQASGRVEQLAIQAGVAPPPKTLPSGEGVPEYGRPGLDGVSLDFKMDQSGGRAQLHLHQGSLTFPGVFEEPRLPFERLQADVSWKSTGPRIDVDVSRLAFANADAEGQGRVRWHTADPATSGSRSRFPGVMDLDVQLSRANGARVPRYLPLVVGSSVRQYLDEAVRQGRATQASFKVRGDLWDFPFPREGSGQFEVRAKLDDVALNYVPERLRPAQSLPWPALDKVSADFRIDRTELRISKASGVVQGQPQLRAVQTEARMADYLSHHPVLQIQGTVRGPGTDALQFVNRSPLRQMTGEVLAQARLSGSVEVALGLQLPLDRVEGIQVQGQVRFNGNDLWVTPETPGLLSTTGTLDFNEHGFRVPQASAKLLGGDLRFSGHMERKGGQTTVRFQGQGTATADGLRRTGEWPWAAELGRQAVGSTPFQARLEFAPVGMSLRIDSALQGLAINLPAPLDKPAGAAWPLRYELTALAPSAGRTAPRDRLSVEIGDPQNPRVLAEFEREADATPRVLRGVVAVGVRRPELPATGVLARLSLGDVDVAAWNRVMDGLGGSMGGAFGGSVGGAAGRTYWPTSFTVSAERLRFDGRAFQDVVLGGSREGDNWRATVAAREFNGYVEYRPGAGQTAARLHARLARLQLMPSAADEVDRLMQQPQQVPALDVVVDDFVLGQRPLGRLEIQAVNRQSADGVREWRLNTLNLGAPEARLQASGNWAPARGSDGAKRTALNVRLDIEDSGALLERFGMPGVMRGGKGRLEGAIGWMGSPLTFNSATLSGDLLLDLQRGQFLKADPGVARLLGVLSLQSLPRRLVLDFRDVFSEGFAFDFVRGNARIDQGIASTNNLQMKGVSAGVLIEGSADIGRETQDITATVIPELNAGTASLLAGMINPVTGIGTLLAQFILREPLQQAATQQFRVTGSWAEPQVERVNRRTIPNEEAPAARPGNSP